MPGHRYRITYGEQGNLRFAGHLDVYRAWERTFRRADLPLEVSQGYNPRPRINIGLALPLGCSSRADLMDVWLVEAIDPGELVQRLQAAAPPGLEVKQAEAIDDRLPKLQEVIQAAEFEVELPAELAAEIGRRAHELLAAAELLRERRGKHYDLRPLIADLGLRDQDVLWMRLVAASSGVGRADEVLRALGLEAEAYVPCRIRLILSEE